MDKDSKIYVAGHKGLVGSAIVRELKRLGFDNLVLRSREELDLLEQDRVRLFFDMERPEFVFLAAAKVGGIMANNLHKADFIYENLLIQNNVIGFSKEFGVKKLLFLGSSCTYPRDCPQPIREEYLLTGPLEETNGAYAIAKIAGIQLVRSFREQYGSDFIAIMPTNLYGPGDTFNEEASHVIPAMIRKFDESKRKNRRVVELWGSGKPRREFMHVDDLASAAVFLMRKYSSPDIINVGIGKDISICELADLVKHITGFSGDISWDTSKPDGTPRKLLDVSRLQGMGWTPSVELRSGILETYKWYVSNIDNI